MSAWWYESEIWTDRAGTAHEIATMPKRYVANVISFLERRAVSIALEDSLYMIRLLHGPLGPSGDMAFDSVEREFNAVQELKSQNAVLWLRDTPLHRALQDRLSGRIGQPDPEWEWDA